MPDFPARPVEYDDDWYAEKEAWDQAVEDAITANETAASHANRAVLDGTTASFTTAKDTKLSGVATGATANSSDATLLARANHTGTQSADTLTDGTTNKAYTATEKTKLSGVATGADVTGAGNVAAAGALMTTDAPELIRDTMGTALVAGTNVTITPSDGSDTITIAAVRGDETAWPVGSWIYPGIRDPLSQTATATNNILTFAQWTPIDIRAAVNVDAMALSVNVAVASSTLRLGIFTFDGATFTLVKDAGTVSGASTGAQIATFSAYQLIPGQYWLGFVPSITGITLNGTTSPRGLYVTEANLFTATHVTCYIKTSQTAQAAGWNPTTTTVITSTGTVSRIGLRRAA